VWISEQTAIISLYNINWLVCITKTECVYCAVRTGYLNIINVIFFFKASGDGNPRRFAFTHYLFWKYSAARCLPRAQRSHCCATRWSRNATNAEAETGAPWWRPGAALSTSDVAPTTITN